MKFTRTRYPDFTDYSSPCWKLKARWLYADADWNTRFPFGTSLSVRIGPYRFIDRERKLRLPRDGFCFDLNPPLGEPNRVYVTVWRWRLTLGLPSLRGGRFTGDAEEGCEVWEDFTSWRNLHIDGIRAGWRGLLTIERRRDEPREATRAD